jgi:hypothetical protein
MSAKRQRECHAAGSALLNIKSGKFNLLRLVRHQIKTSRWEIHAWSYAAATFQNGQIVFGKTEVYPPKDVVCAEQFVQQGDVLIVSSTGSKRSIGKFTQHCTDGSKRTSGNGNLLGEQSKRGIRTFELRPGTTLLAGTV